MENRSDFEADDYPDLSWSNWSNWSTPAAVLYSAMSSVLAATNQTPLPDFGQDLGQSTSSFNHSQS